MAEIERFTALAPRKGNLEPDTSTGAPEALQSVAAAAGRLSSRLTEIAAKKRQTQMIDQANADEASLTMPGVEFAFDGQSAATTPSGAGRALVGSTAEKGAQFKSYLMQKHGVSAEFAAGLVGNFAQESAFNTKAINRGDGQDGSHSIGIGQWNSDRARNLQRFAAAQGKPIDDWQLQLDFAMHELSTTEKAAGDRLRSAKTVEEATAAAIGFERPAGWSEQNPRGGHGWANRLAAAQSVYGAATAAVAGAPAAGAGPVVPPAAQPSTVRVTLTGKPEPVPLMQGGTIAGDAYNKTVLAAHSARLDTAMRQQMDALAIQHEGDPAALGAALDTLRAGYMEALPPAERLQLDRSFQTQKFGLQQQAIAKYRQDTESQTLADFSEAIDTRTRNAWRVAAAGGDPAAIDTALQAELDGLNAQIDGSTLTPLQKLAARRDANEGIVTSRLMGGFEALTDPAQRAAYAAQFQEDYRAGTGFAANLDPKTYGKISGDLSKSLAQDETAQSKRNLALDKAVDDQIGFLKKGLPVPDAVRRKLRSDIAGTNSVELVANLDQLDHLALLQQEIVMSPPGKADAYMAQLRAQMASGGTTKAAETALDMLDTLKTRMAQGLATDPLSWADQAGVTKVEPLNFADAASLSATLSERVTDAQTVAQRYGVSPKYFTPGEADGLKKMLKEAPLTMPSIVSGLAAGLGDATPQALAEISTEAPVLAQVAGLVHATGNERVAVEVAEALDMRNLPNYQSALPTAAKLKNAATGALGGALALMPRSASATMDTAAALFERRAMARGLDMDQFDTEGSPAREAYLEALDDVLGATTRDGVKYGGLTEVNGLTTIAPPDMRADNVQGLLFNLSADDMIFQQPVGTANGVPVSLDTIRRGRLMQVANGRYRIIGGDSPEGDPLYVSTPSGGFFELDIRMLKKSQERRGGFGFSYMPSGAQ